MTKRNQDYIKDFLDKCKNDLSITLEYAPNRDIIEIEEKEMFGKTSLNYLRILHQHYRWFINYSTVEHPENSWTREFLKSRLKVVNKNLDQSRIIDVEDFRNYSNENTLYTLEQYELLFKTEFPKEYKLMLNEIQLMRIFNEAVKKFNKKVYPFNI